MPGEDNTNPPKRNGRAIAAAAAGGRGVGVDEQAAAWWLLYRDGALDDAAAAPTRQFRVWVAADASHAAAWDAMLRTAQALDDMPATETQALRAMARASSARPSAPRRVGTAPAPAPPSRRRLAARSLLAMASFAVVGSAAWWAVEDHWQQPVFSQAYTTPRGQLLNVTLPDGSRLKLDTATTMRVHLYRNRREVQLAQGQAMFSVAPDAARPFTVDAARTRVTVVGTRFQVRQVGDGVGVEVEEGSVRVEQRPADARAATPSGAALQALMLSSGDSVRADADGGMSAIKAVAPTAIAAWRSGRVNFDATPLTDALAEFARYGETHLSVRDPAVAALRVTGSYEIARVRDFAQALPLVLPVRLQVRGSQTEVVAR